MAIKTAEPTMQETGLRRFLPLAVIGAVMALVIVMGWHNYLSFKTIGLNYEVLRAYVAQHLALALAIYVVAYIAVVATSLPGGTVMTLAGGLLFGWRIGSVATVIGATIGATIVFLAARSSLGGALVARAGPWIGRLRDGFQQNAMSYLLFLRLVPAFPFVIVNLVPAVLGVPLRTYVIGTLVGIVPGSTAYAYAGSTLGTIVEAQNRMYAACMARLGTGEVKMCDYHIDAAALISRQLVIAFGLLAILALIPVALKAWSKRHAEG